MDYNYDRFIYVEPINKEESFSLLIYDIISNSKRAKFAKFMESYGKRVQKSAFEIRIDIHKFNKMISEIPQYISSEDSVKIYRVRENREVMCWGNARLEYNDDIVII